MPCRTENYDNYRSSIGYSQDEIDKVTQLLCYMCGEMKNLGLFDDLDGRLIEWAAKHHISDTTRVIQEMATDRFKYTSAGRMASAYIKKANTVHPVSNWHKKWFLDLAEKTFDKYAEEIQEERRLENLRTKAISKLTDEEREILGL